MAEERAKLVLEVIQIVETTSLMEVPLRITIRNSAEEHVSKQGGYFSFIKTQRLGFSSSEMRNFTIREESNELEREGGDEWEKRGNEFISFKSMDMLLGFLVF